MVTEKIKGAAKQVGSALKGRAGILNTLAKEHGEVSALMDKVLSASSMAKEAEDQYPKIRRKLLLHARAEQDVLYTECEKRPETAQALGDAREEHQEIEQLIEQLDATDVGTSQWQELFRELDQVVQQHVEEEESRVFEACEDAFEDHELRDMDRRFEDAKSRYEQSIGDVSVRRGPAGRHTTAT